MKFTIYKSDGIRWSLKGGNNEIIAQGESYKNKADCLAAISLMKSTTTATPVTDLTS